VYVIGVDSLKSTLTSRLRITQGQGAMHFPLSVDREYFEQLTAEYLKTTYRQGRPHRTWERRKGRRAEALDCAVYAYAATFGLAQHGVLIDREADRIALLARTQTTEPARPQTGWLPPIKGWLR
jgi:phage terminase large subunit GpA-like protein